MRRALVTVVQLALMALVAWYFWDRLVPMWHDFTQAKVALSFKPAWIVAAALTVWATYGILIEAWRRVLVGWAQKLNYWPAARIWCLSNLARFIPGRVWSIAGMAVMAKAQGVEIWAATGSAVVIQALAVATGVAVGAAFTPGAQTPATIGLAILLAGAALTPFIWPHLGAKLIHLVKPGFNLKPVKGSAVLLGGLTTLISWLSYGAALWMLAQGLFETTTLTIGAAVGGFAAAYVLGLLAVFTPGGLGVREAVLSGMLTPAIGASQAITLALASRILVTLTEGSSGLLALALRPRHKEAVHEPS